MQRICRVLKVSRSGCCRWIAGAKTREVRQAADEALTAEILEGVEGLSGREDSGPAGSVTRRQALSTAIAAMVP
ncbi:hypothetical protein [Streptomyces sp. NPDC058964]|uniref:hypothetical protein n=1 Tax=Streptomyces sp. NPDC058964 TaxID=3346681 RepID=UPI0036A7B328